MIRGIGIDICPIADIEEMLSTCDDDVLLEIFTEAELKRFREQGSPGEHLAGIFAAKEAIFKASSTGWDHSISLSQIEININPSGQPVAMLYRSFGELMQGSDVHITISHDAGIAVAVAVIEEK